MLWPNIPSATSPSQDKGGMILSSRHPLFVAKHNVLAVFCLVLAVRCWVVWSLLRQHQTLGFPV